MTVDIVVPDRDAVVEVITAPTSAEVDIALLGPPGLRGPQGVAGPAGPPGLDGVIAPTDCNLAAWNFDIINGTANTVCAPGNLCKLRVRLLQDSDVDGMALYVTTAGASLTAGQNFGAIYDRATRTLIAQTVDQTTAFMTVGFAKMLWQGGTRRLTKGEYLAAFWCRGTTGPGLLRTSQSAGPVCNFNIVTSADYRFAYQASAVTTVAPPNLPAAGWIATCSWWVGLTGTPA
jgi:hypothetical protein